MAQVVDQSSAVIDGYDNTGLPVDHLKLNKFYGPDDDNFQKVANVVKQFVNPELSQSHNSIYGNSPSGLELHEISTTKTKAHILTVTRNNRRMLKSTACYRPRRR